MFTRRMQYFMLLLGAIVYYIASGEWLAWVLLLAVAGGILICCIDGIPPF